MQLSISVGDKGYAVATWLMTPLYTPQTQQERAYNESHVATRAIVERTIGRLKGRWLCLDTAGGKLLYKPQKVYPHWSITLQNSATVGYVLCSLLISYFLRKQVCKMIMACCVLHNIANRYGEPLPAAMEVPPLDVPVDPPVGAENNRAAMALRQQLIARF